MIKAAILTISDRCARAAQEDRSGPVIEEILAEHGFDIAARCLVPDEQDRIAAELIRLCDEGACEVLITTGGTGLGPRDVTPEATASVCTRLVPGLCERMRAESLKQTRYAALSRAVAGLRGNTLIVNLPGSPRAVRACLGFIIEVLPHAVAMMRGRGH